VALLLNAGANAFKPADRGVFLGKTPLMWASSQGRTDVVRILISAGADVNFSSSLGNFKVRYLIHYSELTQIIHAWLLLLCGQLQGKNALMWASSQGRVDTVATLLDAGCDVNAVDNDGVSALMWASGSEVRDDKGHKNGLLEKAEKGHVEVVTLLLKYGALPDKRDRDGITAIMYACFHGHAGAVEVLLNAGADASVKNQAGKTALNLAKNAGFPDAVAAIMNGPTILVRGLVITHNFFDRNLVSLCSYKLH
jgi:ankyrin repeat protein